MTFFNPISRLNFRLAAGLVLLTSAVVFGNWPKPEDDVRPIKVQTLSSVMSSCAKRSVKTSFGTLGCSSSSTVRNGGGVMFLRAGHN